ncbi:uncharacterized protein [Littorina saxatilis]|uniref:uncharacterized protein n=1 Tax=Littorina saxatilis TaxID=31220 RepID=UPI0038B66AAA
MTVVYLFLSVHCLSFLFVVVTAEVFPWRIFVEQNVTAYDTMTSAPSAMTCVRECVKQSQCDSCAYDRESGTCFLEVQAGSGLAVAGNRATVYKAWCDPSEAVNFGAGIILAWHLSGLEGDIRCNDDDYMYTVDSPTVRCSHKRIPSPEGQCRQNMWRNLQASYDRYPVPKSPGLNWAACLHGTPTASTSFRIFLEKDAQNRVLQVDTRLNLTMSGAGWSATYIDTFTLASMVNSGYSKLLDFLDVTPFTIRLGQPFLMKIKAATLSDLEFYVDGNLITNFTVPSPLSVDSVSSLYFLGDVDIQLMDLWCQD